MWSTAYAASVYLTEHNAFETGFDHIELIEVWSNSFIERFTWSNGLLNGMAYSIEWFTWRNSLSICFILLSIKRDGSSTAYPIHWIELNWTEARQSWAELASGVS